MIGALALGFPAFEAGFVGFGQVRRGQICRIGDTVRDTDRKFRPAGLQEPTGTSADAQFPTVGGLDRCGPVEWIGNLAALLALATRALAPTDLPGVVSFPDVAPPGAGQRGVERTRRVGRRRSDSQRAARW
jgi:hypothetical protein